MIRTPNAWIFASLFSLLSVLKGYSAISNSSSKNECHCHPFKSISGWWWEPKQLLQKKKVQNIWNTESVSPTMFAAGLKTFAATKLVWRHQTDRPLRVETQLACNIYLCVAWLYFCVAVPRLCACVRMSGVSMCVHAIMCKCVGVVDLGFWSWNLWQFQVNS